MTLAPPEAQRRKVIRLAAGCYNLNDAEGHQGRFVCPDCPDDRFVPPFQPFALNLHIREHEEATGHRIHVYCYVCCDFHTTEAMETPLEITWLAENAPETPLIGPGAVLAAMEVLRQAGYLVRVATAPALPEPPIVLLMYREKTTLEAIRERPGTTVTELAEVLSLKRQNVGFYVRLLLRGGHIRTDGNAVKGRWNSPGHLYPTHDRPLGNVRPREPTRFR